jgi:hypothetical protein
MAGNNSVESQAKHDVQDLKKGGDNTQALQHIADQAHTMSTKDLKSEQNYWNTVGKAGHDHLPGLSIHRNNDGNVDSVKNSSGKDLYDRNAEVKKTVDKFTGGLKKGQGPFHAFKEAGLSDREASEHAKAVMAGTGRNTFNAGEKLGVHSDGSVSTSSEHKGVTTQEKYKKDNSHETKVTQKNGDSKTTFKKADGTATKTVEHKETAPGKSEDITYDGDGTTKKVKEKTTTDGDKSTTKKYRDDSTRSEQIETSPKGTTDTKFGPKGTDDRTEKIETGKDGLKTTTAYDDKTHLPKSQHKETANGYVDTKFKADGSVDSATERKNKPNGTGYTETETRDGKQVSVINRTNGEKGAYTESRKIAANDSRSSANADGSFTQKRIEKQGNHTTTYAMDMKDENHGTGTRIKTGPQIADTKPHKVKFEDGRYSEIK